MLVLGGGPIGFAAADLAQVGGASSVIVVERDNKKREKLNAFSKRAAVEIRESIPASGEFDWIVDAAGVPELASEFMQRAAPHGALLFLARTRRELSIDVEKLAEKNLQIFGVDGHYLADAYPRIISLMTVGKLNCDLMIDRLVCLEEAEKILKQQEKGMGKILVNFESEDPLERSDAN